MKINSNPTGEVETARASRKDEVKHSADNVEQAGSKLPSTELDKVKVSNRAASIGRMVEKLEEVPDIRKERVEILKQKIEAGDYKPPAESIADAILKDEE